MSGGRDHDEADAARVPLVEERLRIETEQIDTGRVVLEARVTEEVERVRLALSRTGIRIERRPIDRIVDRTPPVRREPGRTIVPVMEEVLVKRFRIVEEVHLIEETETHDFDEDVTLRRRDVTVKRD